MTILTLAQSFARKLIHTGRIREHEIEQEVKALQKLCRTGHPNIVTVLRLGQLPASPLFFIDMELCPMSLEEYLYPPSPQKTDERIPQYIKNGKPPSRAKQIWTVMYDIM